MQQIAHFLRRVIHPQNVAVIGASNDASKFGGRVMQFLQKHGYRGGVVAVNPSGDSIFGVTACKSIADAQVAIDVALLAVPAQHLAASLEACGAAGVPCCVVITADFAELGDEGAQREAELVRIARRHGMRLIGPNCLGFINPHLKLALTSSVALALEPLPTGGIGLISQSGSMMASMLSHAADSGAGFSACITVGNQADLEICDFLEYFIEDPGTRAICIYIEGLKDGTRFRTLAGRCREARKPLLALKAGGSVAGSLVARSHTASLAGSHAVWEAVCRDCGVIAVDDPEAMIDCAQFLVQFGPAPAAGIAALSPSGGTIAITADRIEASGLELASLEPATRQALARIVPASRELNPLDVGGLARERGVSAALDAQAAFCADPNVGVVFIVVATTPQLDEKVRRWAAAALAAEKPTAILLTPGSLVDGARQALRELGCPFTNRMDDALRVMRASIDYGRILSASPEAPVAPPYVAAITEGIADLRPGPLTEPEAKALLRTAGIPTTPEAVAASPEGAVDIANRLGYPVVLKAVCRELVHKSDIGAVCLGLENEDAVLAAWQTIEARVRAHLPGAALEGCLVQPMIRGGVEVIIGARWDPQFGAVVVAGAGGVFVEILKDSALALAPLTPARARALLEGLQVWPLLDGARGRTRCDVTALVDSLVRLSWLAVTLGPRLIELDVNPLLVQTQGVVALDARATIN
ncbi:MAG TPA: acetate--CoA ligase family protein [Burkholderiales bacterium]|nr:acetate--CoA ligase family protein [Burkholderiales bacterium]